LLERDVPRFDSVWVLVSLSLTGGCGGDPDLAPPAEVKQTATGTPASLAVDPRLSQTLGDWIAKDWSAPRGTREEKCDDAQWKDLPAEARTLVLAVRDARFEKKQILALDLTGHLTQPKLHALRDELALLAPGRAPSEIVTDEIEQLAKRRFVGVFHITEHYGAERVFRVDRGRWEWLPGTLVTWLSIHDATSGASLCQTQLVVKNDTRGAPLAVRLKSDTRERLTRELGRDVRVEATRALRRISAVLELPEPSGNRPVVER
jgi:hypothetical protein